MALSTFVFPLWGVYVSYRGALTAFRPDPGRARFWFLILPLTLQLVFLLGGIVWGIAQVL